MLRSTLDTPIPLFRTRGKSIRGGERLCKQLGTTYVGRQLCSLLDVALTWCVQRSSPPTNDSTQSHSNGRTASDLIKGAGGYLEQCCVVL